jgi:hypothetical protein
MNLRSRWTGTLGRRRHHATDGGTGSGGAVRRNRFFLSVFPGAMRESVKGRLGLLTSG